MSMKGSKIDMLGKGIKIPPAARKMPIVSHNTKGIPVKMRKPKWETVKRIERKRERKDEKQRHEEYRLEQQMLEDFLNIKDEVMEEVMEELMGELKESMASGLKTYIRSAIVGNVKNAIGSIMIKDADKNIKRLEKTAQIINLMGEETEEIEKTEARLEKKETGEIEKKEERLEKREARLEKKEIGEIEKKEERLEKMTQSINLLSEEKDEIEKEFMEQFNFELVADKMKEVIVIDA